MTGHAMRHPAPMKGRHITGIAPLSGHPRDDKGRIILDWCYGPRPPAPPVDACVDTPVRLGRGGIPTEQAALL